MSIETFDARDKALSADAQGPKLKLLFEAQIEEVDGEINRLWDGLDGAIKELDQEKTARKALQDELREEKAKRIVLESQVLALSAKIDKMTKGLDDDDGEEDPEDQAGDGKKDAAGNEDAEEDEDAWEDEADKAEIAQNSGGILVCRTMSNRTWHLIPETLETHPSDQDAGKRSVFVGFITHLVWLSPHSLIWYLDSIGAFISYNVLFCSERFVVAGLTFVGPRGKELREPGLLHSYTGFISAYEVHGCIQTCATARC
ncbi:hypothetical protein QL093DRAFT_2084766 [Fusarium oxysporum]|nr:hypothetical protein QL093DRAFT_2084766 [Fusarium oxysporum]